MTILLVLIQPKMLLRANLWLICNRPFWRRVGMGDAFWPTLRGLHTVFICHAYLLCRLQQNEMTTKHSKCTLWRDVGVLREWPCCHGSLYITFWGILVQLYTVYVHFFFVLYWPSVITPHLKVKKCISWECRQSMLLSSVLLKAIFLFHKVAALLLLRDFFTGKSTTKR